MTKKNLWLMTALVVIATIYICFFTDWFKPKTITLFDTSRPMQRFHGRKDLPYIMFGITEGKMKLTEVKVVPLDSFKTNSATPAMWHLVSDSNSTPVQRFVYGQRIGGMKPYVQGLTPQPLETNVTYRLFVVAGKEKGEHDFEIK
ncbi:MAG TPA: hypothetical protein VMH87_14275 [Pseudomonadales bacterium]|nr:hypothetical protein [Pseudomonadales bacterium]